MTLVFWGDTRNSPRVDYAVCPIRPGNRSIWPRNVASTQADLARTHHGRRNRVSKLTINARVLNMFANKVLVVIGMQVAIVISEFTGV